jgi:hypothetical protein
MCKPEIGFQIPLNVSGSVTDIAAGDGEKWPLRVVCDTFCRGCLAHTYRIQLLYSWKSSTGHYLGLHVTKSPNLVPCRVQDQLSYHPMIF